METITTAWTEEALMALPKDGFKHELIEGEIIMSPAGFNHERLGVVLLSALSQHATKHALGVVLGSSLGCWMSNGDLLSPDVSFIAKDRLPVDRAARQKYFQGSPDLVVEILSPFDTMGKMRKKSPAISRAAAVWPGCSIPPRKAPLSTRSLKPRRRSGPTACSTGKQCCRAFNCPSPSCSPNRSSTE